MEYSPREERFEMRLQSCWSPALVMLVSVMSTVRSEEQIGCSTCSCTRHSSFVTRHSSFLNHSLTWHSSAPAHVRGIHHYKIIFNAAFIIFKSFVNAAFLILKSFVNSSFLSTCSCTRHSSFVNYLQTRHSSFLNHLLTRHSSFSNHLQTCHSSF